MKGLPAVREIHVDGFGSLHITVHQYEVLKSIVKFGLPMTYREVAEEASLEGRSVSVVHALMYRRLVKREFGKTRSIEATRRGIELVAASERQAQ